MSRKGADLERCPEGEAAQIHAESEADLWRRLPRAAVAGLLATVAMDAGARTTIAPLLGVEALGPHSLGRWVGHMRKGRFAHTDIAAAPPVDNEAAIGIVTHYAIGAILGAGYGLLTRADPARRGSLPRALAYGTGTTLFSWLVMLPATGRGLSGRRENRRLAALSLANHVVYGLALGAATRRLLTPARAARADSPRPLSRVRSTVGRP